MGSRETFSNINIGALHPGWGRGNFRENFIRKVKFKLEPTGNIGKNWIKRAWWRVRFMGRGKVDISGRK